MSFQSGFGQKANIANIINRGFRPELYTVANGTYESNAVYGVGAPMINTYSSIQIPRGTSIVVLTPGPPPVYVNSTEGCDIRQQDCNIDFIINVCLDGNPLTEPNFGNQELRVRPQQFPYRSRVPLPLSKNYQPSPTFVDVEITNKMGVQISPIVGGWLLGARLLRDGTIALTKRNINIVGVQEVALFASDIDGGFVADDVIFITLRGTYEAQSSISY